MLGYCRFLRRSNNCRWNDAGTGNLGRCAYQTSAVVISDMVAAVIVPADMVVSAV